VTGALTHVLLVAATKSSGSSTFIIFLVLIALVGYFLLLRPQQQKAKRQRAQQSNIAVGDEVVTVGGIVGRVIALDADRVTLLSGEDTVGFPAVGNEPTRLVLVRNAVARKVEPTVMAPDLSDADGAGTGTASYDDEHDEHGDENDEHGDEHDEHVLGLVEETDPAAGDGRAAEGGGAGS
jgi:preprotein translocase subunit YajC